MGKGLYFLFGAVILFGLIFVLAKPRVNGYTALETFEGDIKLYKTGSCGCCGVYANYFKGKGNSKTEIISLENIDDIKRNYGIPTSLESCHTIIVGNYFVEGHIPLEAVEKLLKEKPNIKGIAMPGMPSGSPGMPGAKKGDFVIYGVNQDGTTFEFMRI